MRDFRDAKVMAQTIRATLAEIGHKITVSQSLELIAEAFGVANWNTLSAAISTDLEPPRQNPSVAPPQTADSPSTPEHVGFSPELEATIHRAVASAKHWSHEYATLEHLLLALVDDAEASAAIKACNVDLGVLRRDLSHHLDTVPSTSPSDDAKPTAGFQRVIQRAVIHLTAGGGQSVTGANVLVALFSEKESRAVHFLSEQAMSRVDAVNFIAHGVVKRGGEAEG